jgi:flagellar protein FlaJ
MKRRQKKKKAEKPQRRSLNRFLDKYKKFCFQVMGKRFDQPDKYKNLAQKLKMANMRLTAPVFMSVIIFSGLLIFIISLIIYLLIFNIIIPIESWLSYSLGLTLVNTSFSIIFLPLLMRMKISSRKLQIERELPFTLSELSVLASTGLTPIKIVRHMAQRKINQSMNLEFRKIVHKIDIEGKDIVTALGETAKESPSDTFRESLWDLSNMIHQGGDLDVYLRQKADNTMQLRRDVQKEFTQKLASYAEMYISLVLISIIFVGVAAFLMNAMASSMSGIDADTLLMMLAFLIIPIAVISITTMISTAYSRSG